MTAGGGSAVGHEGEARPPRASTKDDVDDFAKTVPCPGQGAREMMQGPK